MNAYYPLEYPFPAPAPCRICNQNTHEPVMGHNGHLVPVHERCFGQFVETVCPTCGQQAILLSEKEPWRFWLSRHVWPIDGSGLVTTWHAASRRVRESGRREAIDFAVALVTARVLFHLIPEKT